MNSNKIKAMLVERGIKQVEIARILRLTRGAVNKVLSGQAKSRRVRQCVIALLGDDCRKYWGDAA